MEDILQVLGPVVLGLLQQVGRPVRQPSLQAQAHAQLLGALEVQFPHRTHMLAVYLVDDRIDFTIGAVRVLEVEGRVAHFPGHYYRLLEGRAVGLVGRLRVA